MHGYHYNNKEDSVLKIGFCALKQRPLAFEWNLKNIIWSIEKSASNECLVRTGPELELTGYGCKDHFFEDDLYLISWKYILIIMKFSINFPNMLIDIGM